MSRIVWVTGAGGLIGSHLVRAAAELAPNWIVRALTRAELDLLDSVAVERVFRQDQPELIIHCAALSKSPTCQAEPKLAWRINFETTRHLAELAFEARLVFFSTDLVFDGRTGGYSETSPVNPLSVYAETKVAAERVVLRNPRHTVLRTSLNGGRSPTGDRGFNEQLRLLWQKGEKLRLFVDEFRSPISSDLTARAVWEIVAQDLHGLFHVAGNERLSRFEIGQLLAARWPRLNPQFEAASFRDYPGPPRAPDTSLDCRKIQPLLSFPLTGLRAWLQAHPQDVF
jgi:dTDP-4-dehydrorhamnose reductase